VSTLVLKQFGERGLYFAGPAAWNSLPSHLHCITDTVVATIGTPIPSQCHQINPVLIPSYYAFATEQCGRRRIMFPGCPADAFMRSLVRSSGQIMLPRYPMNASKICDETDRKYSLAPVTDRSPGSTLKVKDQRPRSQQAAAKASTSTLGRQKLHLRVSRFTIILMRI